MKILITESQMEDFFMTYLKKFKPELFNLSKYPTRRSDKTVYGYDFEIGDTLILVFEYLIEPEWERDLNDEFPKLRMTRKLKDEIQGMFGEEGIRLLVKWFEEYYQLPVKSIN
jgi:hypothetical protein